MLRCSALLVLTFITLTVQSEELEVLTKLYMNKGSKKSKIFFKGYGPVFLELGGCGYTIIARQAISIRVVCFHSVTKDNKY